MSKINILLAMVGVLALATCLEGANNQAPRFVRINLKKQIQKQGGKLGQPVTSYYVNVDIGNPPKAFRMLLDINAREIWLPHYSSLGRLYTRLNYKDGYRKKESTTSVKDERQIYEIFYKGCKLGGKAYTDQFELKDVLESAQTVKYSQRFLAISDASSDEFTRFEVNGVVALNPWPISETGSDLMPLSLARANLINSHVFGLALDNNDDSEQGGELTLGGFNPTKFIGALSYHQLQDMHSWQVNLRAVMIGAESIVSANDNCKAIISTSENDIYGPTRFVKRIMESMGLANSTDVEKDTLQEVSCLKVATAPSITFIIDDAYYTLQPTSYIRRKVSGLIFKSETCYVAILPNGSTDKWELGTNFVSNYYAVFDNKDRRIGLANRGLAKISWN